MDVISKIKAKKSSLKEGKTNEIFLDNQPGWITSQETTPTGQPKQFRINQLYKNKENAPLDLEILQCDETTKNKSYGFNDSNLGTKDSNISIIAKKLGIAVTKQNTLNEEIDTPEDIRRVMKGDLKGSTNFNMSLASRIKKTWSLRHKDKVLGSYDENISSNESTPLVIDISRGEDSSTWEPESDNTDSSDDSYLSVKECKASLLQAKKKPKCKGKKISNGKSTESDGATPSPLKGFKRLVLRD